MIGLLTASIGRRHRSRSSAVPNMQNAGLLSSPRRRACPDRPTAIRRTLREQNSQISTSRLLKTGEIVQLDQPLGHVKSPPATAMRQRRHRGCVKNSTSRCKQRTGFSSMTCARADTWPPPGLHAFDAIDIAGPRRHRPPCGLLQRGRRRRHAVHVPGDPRCRSVAGHRRRRRRRSRSGRHGHLGARAARRAQRSVHALYPRVNRARRLGGLIGAPAAAGRLPATRCSSSSCPGCSRSRLARCSPSR